MKYLKKPEGEVERYLKRALSGKGNRSQSVTKSLQVSNGVKK